MAGLVGQRSVGFLGVGSMNQAILSGLLESKSIAAEKLFASNRSQGKLKKVVEQKGVTACATNEELLEKSEIVILGVKPQDLFECLEPLNSSFDSSHIVVSLAAGVPLQSLEKVLSQVRHLVRVMPNTAANIKKAVVGYCTKSNEGQVDGLIEDLFSPLGYVVKVEEGEEFEALTVGASSGIGFVFELMLYWREWLEEHGFSPKVAEEITVQTFLGAACLAEASPSVSIDELQKRVVSRKGVTASGLDSMQELEVERALRYSFEKAVLRDRQLGKSFG